MALFRNLRRLCVLAAIGLLFGSCANQVVFDPSLLHSQRPEEVEVALTKEPTLTWSFKLPAEPSAPAVLFGSILAVPLTSRTVLFVDKNTGKEIGEYDLSGVPAGAVYDGRENLILAEKSGNGELLSYSLVDGGVDWRFSLNEAGEVPILTKGEADPTGTVVAVNRRGWVYALRADDGKPLWNQQLAPLSCAPVGADSVFHLVDFEGKLNVLSRGKVLRSHKQPSVILCLESAGTRLFGGGEDSSLACFNEADGRLLWKAKTDGKVRSLAVEDSLVFFASIVGTVSACRTADGGKIWERKLEALVNAPLLAAGGAVLAGTAEGRLLALAASNGEILWERRIQGGPVGRPILEGNRLFLAAAGKRLLAFRF